FERVVILTGAGISVASGLGTYRGPGGLWEGSGVNPAATGAGIQEDPWGCWQFFLPLREQILAAEPNPAHLALADLARRLRGGLTLVTQNVDGLHSRAGSTDVLELHGSLLRSRCDGCQKPPFEDSNIYSELPLCDCGAPLRPDIVLFDEAISVHADHLSKRALRQVELFVAIGTSGTVAPANRFVRSAAYAGATTLEINTQRSGAFDLVLEGRAEMLVPEWVKCWPKARRTTVLFSDLHGKVERLQQLLGNHRTARFVSVGDALGSGQNAATLDLLRKHQVPCLRGNHEFDLLEIYKGDLTQDHLDWIFMWPLRFVEEDFCMVHSWLGDGDRVDFQRLESKPQVAAMFAAEEFRVAFVGHSHSPGYWQQENRQEPSWIPATPELRLEWEPGVRYLIDLGSLGEPIREDHPNYVIWDDTGVTWKRLEPAS
ncbi:MAG: metallophosphoesterase family protein, partial [Candidatus Eremiobacteraeota bacterium]|nr:metallophosphoesterase family protein [Candidatus Eremiobacteraeota bacterium]